MFILSQNLVNSPNLNFDTKFKELYLHIRQKKKSKFSQLLHQEPSIRTQRKPERNRSENIVNSYILLARKGPQKKENQRLKYMVCFSYLFFSYSSWLGSKLSKINFSFFQISFWVHGTLMFGKRKALIMRTQKESLFENLKNINLLIFIRKPQDPLHFKTPLFWGSAKHIPSGWLSRKQGGKNKDNRAEQWN